MAISVELPMFSSYRQVSGVVSLSHFASKDVLYNPLSRYRRFGKELNIISRPSRPIFMRVVRDSSSLNGYESGERKVRSGDLGADSEVVEVIGIGSRKDAIIDFCLDSLFQSVSLRFWNILTRDPLDVKLQQSVLGKDITPKIVESSQFMQSCSKAIILVASAGYGLDHIAAIDILKTIRCGNGFAFAIVLRPFSFEGRRRINEVNDLMEKLQQHVIFCIDVDTDMLLKKDLVTLDEALKTANNAVLLGINAISILISGMHRKFLDVMHNNVKELKVSEIMKILENCKEAKVGIGAGRNIETSILQAIYDCPFIGAGVKDLNGVVICVVASSGPIENNDMQAFLHTFRRSTQCKKEIVISIIHEPNMERNLLVATVVTVSFPQQEPSQKSSIFSRLAQHLPFVFNLLRRDHRQPNDKEGINVLKNAVPSIMTNSPLSAEVENGIAVGGYAEGFDNYSEEPGTVFNSHYDETYALSESEQSNNGSLENRMKSFDFLDQFTEGTLAFQREPTTSWNLGTGHETTQQWTERGAADSGDTPVLDTLSSFSLPVGVRPSEEFKDGVNEYTQHQEPTTEDDAKARPLVHSSKTESNFYDTASALLKGKKPDILKKEGNLSVRAASMLEAERDSPKKWSPVLEMQYRGGTYKGRCQGGLPEGKGRLVLVNGSIYDGMWHYGKRSGLGTFYFSNGDVFQGTWRDDVMHGKGWFYFHTGDRWFANFWKGKANGEGRFYSKCGDVFFGHFQDGWRHGRFLCIDVYGERYIEVWDKGILVTRELLDSDANAE